MILEKNLKFNIPGKTFLVGEYAVLSGGSCLGLGTNPSFAIDIQSTKQTFHPDSPAGLYLKKNNLENFLHNFDNPYGVGGFGASTAEFIFSYFSNQQASKKMDDVFTTYLNLYADRKSQKPSGADLVTQLVGGLSHIDLSSKLPIVEKLNWTFSDLEFLIFSTGLKVKTHEHLADLDRKICDDLVGDCDEVIRVFKSNDSQSFKEAMARWSKKLEQMGLTAKPVLELKAYLQSQIPELIVKPCGALGADVVVILCPKQRKEGVLQQIRSLNIPGLNFQADSTHLTNGPLSI